MKRSKYEKLKVGDMVTLRTLEELETLKAYQEGGLRDDDGFVWHSMTVPTRGYGKQAEVLNTDEKATLTIHVRDAGGMVFRVIRQSLR